MLQLFNQANFSGNNSIRQKLVGHFFNFLDIIKWQTKQPTRWWPGGVSYMASTTTCGCLLPVLTQSASSPHRGQWWVPLLWLFSCWGGHLWCLKGNTSKMRKRWRVLAFDGHHFDGQCNNQLQNVSGGAFAIVWVANWSTKITIEEPVHELPPKKILVGNMIF